MFTFTAEFPKNIDSRELFEMVKPYQMNVLDAIDKTYLYGEIHRDDLFNIIMICLKFDVVSFDSTKNRP